MGYYYDWIAQQWRQGQGAEFTPAQRSRSAQRRTLLTGLLNEIDDGGDGVAKLYAGLLARHLITRDETLMREFGRDVVNQTGNAAHERAGPEHDAAAWNAMTKRPRRSPTNISLENGWAPPLGIRATWCWSAMTEHEAVLAAALDNLVRHDNAADRREDLPNCLELQHAMEVLNAIAGKKLWEPRRWGGVFAMAFFYFDARMKRYGFVKPDPAMLTPDDLSLLNDLIQLAQVLSGGNLTLMRNADQWQVGLVTPEPLLSKGLVRKPSTLGQNAVSR
jgi:hypothetical protein